MTSENELFNSFWDSSEGRRIIKLVSSPESLGTLSQDKESVVIDCPDELGEYLLHAIYERDIRTTSDSLDFLRLCRDALSLMIDQGEENANQEA